LKELKKESAKMEVYNILIEYGCVEFDIFIRSVHYFNIKLDSSIEGDIFISNFLLETFFIE
jgi:hypothetical protein